MRCLTDMYEHDFSVDGSSSCQPCGRTRVGAANCQERIISFAFHVAGFGMQISVTTFSNFGINERQSGVIGQV